MYYAKSVQNFKASKFYAVLNVPLLGLPAVNQDCPSWQWILCTIYICAKHDLGSAAKSNVHDRLLMGINV